MVFFFFPPASSEEVTSWAVAQISGKCNMWALLGISSCGSAVFASQTVTLVKCFSSAGWSRGSTHIFKDLLIWRCQLQNYARSSEEQESIWNLLRRTKSSGFHSGRKLLAQKQILNKVVGSKKMHSLLFFSPSEWRLYLMEAVFMWRSKETLEW